MPEPGTNEPLLVLIIDDIPDNCDVYEHYLTEQGASVICARDGEQGLALAKTRRPDVIVLDLGLPGIDGWEVARRLRGDSVMTDIPIVACTAHASTDAHRRALEAGIDVFLVKPCPPDVLLAEIRTLRQR